MPEALILLNKGPSQFT